MNDELLKQLEKVSQLAKTSKWGRFINNPLTYLNSLIFNKIIYPFNYKAKEVKCHTFFNQKMQILLPSSTDIYLTGGKTHDSEIRLASYMIQHLKEGNTFIDVGAHYGYYSLLAHHLVGKNGHVYGFEPTRKTFQLLIKNTIPLGNNIVVFQRAIAQQKGEIEFFDFPNKFSEYNTFEKEQFKEEWWFKHANSYKVQTSVLDEIVLGNNIENPMIKIDVEGAEFQVISGLTNTLKTHSPIIIIEYLSENRNNKNHQKAIKLIKSFLYKSYIINDLGQLEACDNIDDYFNKNNIESDNIVLMKN